MNSCKRRCHSRLGQVQGLPVRLPTFKEAYKFFNNVLLDRKPFFAARCSDDDESCSGGDREIRTCLVEPAIRGDHKVKKLFL